MKSALLGIVAFALVSAVACREPLDPLTSKILPVSEIDAPATIAAGSLLSVDLIISVGCNSVERVEVIKSASVAHITFWAPAVRGSENIECAMAKWIKQTVTIDPPFAQSFTVSGNAGTLPPVEVRVEVR
jgi:hypothetical protein